MNCHICGTEAVQIFISNKDNTGLCRCSDCGVFFTYPRADKSTLKEFYSKKDYFKHWFEYSDVKIKTDTERVHKILDYVKTPVKLLDFGCGPGIFLKCALDSGFDVYGIEYSDFAVNYCKKNNLKVELFDALPLNFNDDFFDVVTLWHTLEHLEEPVKILNDLKRILKDRGLLVIEIPNYNGLLSRLRGNKSLPLIEHLFHYTEASLEYLLKKNGFEIIDINPGRPGYTRGGLKVYIKKIFALTGIMVHQLTGINCADTILVYCRKK